MNTVIKTIRAIKADKQSRNIFPTHATRYELLKAGCKVEDIRQAVHSGMISFGRTLNDYYFVENENKSV